MQEAADLQHAVHQYVNNTAIHVEGHAVAPASQPVHQADEYKCQQASVVLRREEVVISAVELVPVSRSLRKRKASMRWTEGLRIFWEKASTLAY